MGVISPRNRTMKVIYPLFNRETPRFLQVSGPIYYCRRLIIVPEVRPAPVP
jgi:hypothetical protein